MTVQIPLRNRRREVVAYALVDDDDAGMVQAAGPWHRTRQGYARHNFAGGHVVMHRLVLGLSDDDQRVTDHINRDKLDNRKANLRAVDVALNNQNRAAHKGSTSSHRGVSWQSSRKQWLASACINGKPHYIGRFKSEAEAAAAVAEFRIAHMPGAVS